MELAKLFVQIMMIVITIAGIGGYAAMNIFYYRKSKKMSQKLKKTVIIAKLFLAAALVCLAFVLIVHFSAGAQIENVIIALLAGIYLVEQMDFLLKVDD